MICVAISIVNVRSKLFLLLDNFISGANVLNMKDKKNLKGTKTAWDKFLKPAVNVDAPLIDMAVSAKTKNPEVGQATTIVLQNISRGKNFN